MSRQRYARILGEWEALGRRLPDAEARGTGPTVAQLCHAYGESAKTNYAGGELAGIKTAMRVLRQFCGETQACDVGPNTLRLVRESMVRGDLTLEKPRAPRARTHVNSQIHRVRAIFKWAVSHEIVEESVYRALLTLEPLKRGRSGGDAQRRV